MNITFRIDCGVALYPFLIKEYGLRSRDCERIDRTLAQPRKEGECYIRLEELEDGASYKKHLKKLLWTAVQA